MRFLATLIALLCLSAGALADPVGRYDVNGTNPGSGSPYSGSVTVERTGDTYRVTWTVGRQEFVGTGIGNRNFLAVSYRSGNQTGLAMYYEEDGRWQGVWTYANGREIGTENWRRR
jgi:hypothetical protein